VQWYRAGSYLRLIDSCITQLRLKDLLGPVTRVKKSAVGAGGALESRDNLRGESSQGMEKSGRREKREIKDSCHGEV